jgi:uncharacterized membrane protein YhaH (DUF805 family)
MQADGSRPEGPTRPRAGEGPLRALLVPALAGFGIGFLPLLLISIETISLTAFGGYRYLLTIIAFWLFLAAALATPVCLLVRRLRPAGWGLLLPVLMTLVAAWLYFHPTPFHNMLALPYV